MFLCYLESLPFLQSPHHLFALDSAAVCRYWPNINTAFIIPGGQFNGQVTGVDTNIPPVKPNSPAAFSSKTHINPTPSSLPQYETVSCRSAKQKELQLPDRWGSFLCLIEFGIPSLGPDLLCATRVQLRRLRPLVAPVSSPAPNREDCPASFDPCANYFQSSQDLYHTHSGASGTTARPGSSFSGFSLLLGRHRLSPWT